VRLIFHEQAWEDYRYWQEHDRKMLKRVNRLIEECRRTPLEGVGNPEPLKHNWSGFWSRRINQEHRFVYAVQDDALLIAQCRFHY